MSKRRERRRGKHAMSDSVADEIQTETSEPDSAESAQSGEPLETAESVEQPDSIEPGEPIEPAEPIEPSVSVEQPEPVEELSAEPAEPVEETSVEPSVPVGATEEPAEDLDALGKMLERSLTGDSEGPLPKVSASGQAGIDLSPNALPPDINATPEDILGVQTHQSSMRDLQEQAAQEAAAVTGDRPETTLSGTGGTKPMEAFEERSQMASEVLHATSNQNTRTPTRTEIPKETAPNDSGDAGEDDQQPEERDEDVRFSEDLTISAKRRRRLFGR
jgi:hypothetical protein